MEMVSIGSAASSFQAKREEAKSWQVSPTLVPGRGGSPFGDKEPPPRRFSFLIIAASFNLMVLVTFR
jgi:hypothetical protein